MIKSQISNLKSQISKKGFALVTVLIVMALLLLLGAGVLTSVLFDLKISRAQAVGVKAYYLAEAGINEAVWKLENDTSFNDPTQDDSFEKNPNWIASFSRDFNGSRYNVIIQNIALAQGEITSTATIDLDGKTARREIKTEVFKAVGGPTKGIAIFSGGGGKHKMEIKNSVINVYYGNIFSNGVIHFKKKGSKITATDDPTTIDDPDTPDKENLEGKLLAVKEIKKPKKEQDWPTLDLTAICAEGDDTCTSLPDCAEQGGCPPIRINMPKVDFNKGPNSYKKQAETLGTLYTEKVFENMLWTELGTEEKTLTLTGPITYVRGSVRLRGGITLVITNGVLVVEKKLEIGKQKDWQKRGEDQKYTGNNRIEIYNDNPDLEGGPATGLLAKEIKFGEYLEDSTITGLLYASKKMEFKKIPNTLTVEGGIMAEEFKKGFEDLAELNVTLNDTIIRNVLENQTYSPLVDIEHWEEIYWEEIY